MSKKTKQKKATTKPKAAVQEHAQADEWLTTREACEYLSITKATLLKWAKKYKWTVNQVYGVYGAENRYKRAELDQATPYSKRGNIPPAIRGKSAILPYTGYQEITDLLRAFADEQQRYNQAVLAEQQKANDIAEQQTAEQRRANDLRERELALQVRRFELEMSQSPGKNAATVPPLGIEQGQSADWDASRIARTPGGGLRAFAVRLLRAMQRILET